MTIRQEYDSPGEAAFPETCLWGAQTQRSLDYFQIGAEKMPIEIIRALALIKKAAAQANAELGRLEKFQAAGIMTVCEEIAEGRWNDQFPLSVWQTGSGTQTNMNLNEVIANRANKAFGERRVHPNDHVNLSQSTNDVFPSAIHLAAVRATEDRLLPELGELADTFELLCLRYDSVLKAGRTHLQDAVPMTFGQEIGAWQSMLEHSRTMIRCNLDFLRELAIGGTAVGTGLNAGSKFGRLAVRYINEWSGQHFSSADNKFYALSSRDGLVVFHGALKALAVDLYKIANDVRWLASGPRCGLGEIRIPENEPGSSIMPGKVNPTQCEALTMVCCQVMGNDAAIGFAASQGNFQLNVYLPLLAYQTLQSINLLADAMRSFHHHCAAGIVPDEERMRENVEQSLMLVTALTPRIGYDAAARIARHAFDRGISLKKAAVELEMLSAEEFDRLVDPRKMAEMTEE